jgi:hypothetical protein
MGAAVRVWVSYSRSFILKKLNVFLEFRFPSFFPFSFNFMYSFGSYNRFDICVSKASKSLKAVFVLQARSFSV